MGRVFFQRLFFKTYRNFKGITPEMSLCNINLHRSLLEGSYYVALSHFRTMIYVKSISKEQIILKKHLLSHMVI